MLQKMGAVVAQKLGFYANDFLWVFILCSNVANKVYFKKAFSGGCWKYYTDFFFLMTGPRVV